MHGSPSDTPASVPSMTDEETDQALCAILRERLRPVAIGMALLYGLLTIGHLLVLEDPVRTPMTLLAVSSALVFTLLAILLGRSQPPTRMVHPIVLLGVLIVLANSLVHLLYVPELKHSTNVALLVIMIGSMVLSVRWFVASCAIAVGGWLIVVFASTLTDDLVHYLFLIAQSLLLSTTIFITRRRSNLRIVRLRFREDRQRQALVELAEHRRRAEQIADHARERAEAASQAKSAFLANMTHELRTPLTSIMGYSELMERQLATGKQDTAIEDLGRIRQAGKHLMALINEVLDLSKIEAGRITLHADRVDLQSLVELVIDTIQPLADANQNQIAVQITPGLAYFYSDEVRVRQVLINLMSNACKFTHAGAITLAVGLSCDDTGRLPRAGASILQFSIRDTGIGISADQQRALFQDYAQLDADGSPLRQGTGLGLALSRRLARLMGGDIMVTSQPGKGSLFLLTLPYRASLEESAEQALAVAERP
jgi:signal transduction histidine kinase